MLSARVLAAYQRGLVAAVLAAVISSTVAALAAWPSPLEATAEFLMQWTPLGIADFLLTHASAIARPLALLGSLAVVMLIGGVAASLGALWPAGRVRAIAGVLIPITLLALFALFLVRPSSIMPDICLVLIFGAVLAAGPQHRKTVSGRRQFLERTGIIVGGAAVLISIFGLEPILRGLPSRRFLTFRPITGLRLLGITDLVTARDKFYIMDKVLEYPPVDIANWRLTVSGAVDRPLTLNYDSLLRLPRESRYVTMECVDNPVGGRLISNALWTGVRVRDILDAVGARGDTVVFHGVDDYPESAPVGELTSRNALIAFGMNGEALPREHGFPARLLLPGIYGFKSVKWLVRLEVVSGSRAGAWHAHGWTENAVIHTGARIDVARRSGETILLGGIAFAGNRGVSAVEVRVNRGPWRRATLGPVLSHETWVQWAVRMAGPGRAFCEVRVIDGAGRVQTSRRRDAYPDGSSGWATASV